MDVLYKSALEKKSVVLPIIKIDGIPVSAKLNVINGWDNESTTIYLEISVNPMYLYHDVATTMDEFEQMMNSIKNMKFDTFSGEFYTPTAVTYKPRQPSFFAMPFLEFANVEMNYDECCVCFHNTITMTPCDHFLCYGCRIRLAKNICPLCRTNLSHDIILD
jgi:hypothetical protein